MKGVKIVGHKKVVVEEFPDPEPGYDEAVVALKASCLCRSDMSLYYGDPVLGKTGAFIPGHEPCGVVQTVGQGVTTLKKGDRVAVYLGIGCGHCQYCRKGEIVYCNEFKCIGFHLDGGHADLIRVPAQNCLKIPDKMSYLEGAMSTDKVGTLYYAQKKLGISGSDSVAIIGLGPMGSIGVSVAKALGAKVIAVDLINSRLELAKSNGADYVIDASKVDPVEQIRTITEGLGADFAVDCTGNSKAENDALNCTKKGGSVAFIGESKVTTINPSDQLIRKQLKLIGSWYFPIWMYDEIAKFIMTRNIQLENFVTHRFVIDEAQKAYEMFDNRETVVEAFVW
jgi:propanol-preferring alcohol dehydrogenase